MDRGILLCSFLFIICGQKQVTSIGYHLQDAIEDLNFFIPGSILVLSKVIDLWTDYGEVKQMVDPNSTAVINKHLQQIHNNLSQISDHQGDISDETNTISDDVNDVKELISDEVIKGLPNELGLDNKMIRIYSDMNMVNALFERFLRYNDASQNYDNSTLLNFSDNIVDHSRNGLFSILNHIHYILTDEYSGVNMLNILSDNRLSVTMMCKRQESAQHFINNLYNNIMITEVKGLVMIQFAYSIKNAFSNKLTSYLTELDDANIEYYNRTSKSIAEIKKAMYDATRDFWSCDPVKHVEGITYAKLAPIFQTYVMNEEDAGMPAYSGRYTNKCSDTCAERTESTDLCRSKYYKKHGRKCIGRVHNCKSYSSHLKICLADEKSTRRYEYIELKGKKTEVLGSKQSCNANSALTVSNRIHFANKCEYCLCTCENINIDIDRYFSLKNVTSHVDRNFVVTGVRFVKKNNIFHIQIKQGQLIKHGNINGSTVQWKPIHNFTIHDRYSKLNRDYHNITWIDRTVHLDTIDSPLNNVLTGLRLQSKDNYLKLEIQVTPFNFDTGELKTYESMWISNSDNAFGRTELNLDNYNIATSTYTNLPDSSNNQYIKFTTSSLKTDIGQTVNPFIDLQEITSSPSVPLSGAGLIHRGDKESAGFLSFKVFTYNYAPYLQN